MEFNKAYNRGEFVNFLQNSFLPEDFIPITEQVIFTTQMKYSTKAIKLGSSDSLDLVVYEIRHTSKHDARVTLSKEAFRMLADEMEGRALVIFVPEDNSDNYRFSFIEITLDAQEGGSRITRNYSNPRRYSYFLGKDIAFHTPNKYLNEKGRVVNDEDLHMRFSVEILTKEFYQELSDWYAWAIRIIRFPNDINDKKDDAKYNHESAIRLITRLIFVWFLKQRHLIPDVFFDEKYIADNLLKDFAPNLQIGLFALKSHESKYYKAILQNLFFAMLNSPITEDSKSELSERHFRKLTETGRADRASYDNNKLMRYEVFFKDPQLFIDLANKTVPFLNGGLFDCLDNKDSGLYYDGFSDRELVKNSLIVPDYLFFGEEVGKNIDLSEWYGDTKKKKVSARGIIDILKRYNFTVEENTPFDKEVSLDPELLGKVFENLLASFNPETQTTARKQTGSFYTPREIVQFMVDESLVAHLKRTVGEELESQYRQLVQYTDDIVELTDEQRRDIMHSLYNCKILDPACGSGAFPMGILQQMVHILNRIDSDNKMWKEMMLQQAVNETSDAYRNSSNEERAELIKDIERNFDESTNRPDYARKLYLIENCIYGVDIQPIAIQISKLRFFISLVADQKTNSNPVDNFGIRPLPNLEAKFVAANTLIGLQKKDANLFDSDIIKSKENVLKAAKHKIFSAKTVNTKRKYRDIVTGLRLEISNLLMESGSVGNAEAQQLASWDMFDQNAYSPFFDPEWMFGVKDGFDIAIGNPPYVQLQSNEGALRKKYQDYKYETFASTGDLYSLFYERGWRLLDNGGFLCFITSNKWMRARYGEATRKFFTNKTNPIQLIDFSGTKVFESATVDTNILLFSKSKNQRKTRCATVNKQNLNDLNNLSAFVQQTHTICNFVSSESWVILSPIEQSIKQKIESVGTPLKDWDIQINYGIKTGFNDAFIISTDKRNEILDRCKSEDERARTAELIRPILRGRDIKKYGYDWADLWLIWVPWHFPLHFDESIQGASEIAEDTFRREYPSVYAHLSLYKKQLSARNKAETGIRYEWYALQRWGAKYWDDFSKPKIVYPETTQGAYFAFDDKGLFIDKTCFMLISDEAQYLQHTLSSRLFEFAYKNIFSSIELGEHGYQYNKHALVKLPVLKCSDSSILNDVQDIDEKIYTLYDISEDEIRFIESR